MVPFGEYIGVPSPKISVPLTGVMMLVAAVTIALGFWADLGAILLVLFLPAGGATTGTPTGRRRTRTCGPRSRRSSGRTSR